MASEQPALPRRLFFPVISALHERDAAGVLIEKIRTGGTDLPFNNRKFGSWTSDGRGGRWSRGDVETDKGPVSLALKFGAPEGLFLEKAEDVPRFFPLRLVRGDEAWILHVPALSPSALYHVATQIVAHAAYRGFPYPNADVFHQSFLRRARQQHRVDGGDRITPPPVRRCQPYFIR